MLTEVICFSIQTPHKRFQKKEQKPKQFVGLSISFKQNNRGREQEVVNFTKLLFEPGLSEVELREGNAIFQPWYILPSYSFPARR